MRGRRLHTANKIAKKQFKKYHPEAPILRYPTDEEFLGEGGRPFTMRAVLGYYRKTKVFCSGVCCGNPRRHFGEITRQEKKAPRIDEWI
jgi:hypothetical protein